VAPDVFLPFSSVWGFERDGKPFPERPSVTVTVQKIEIGKVTPDIFERPYEGPSMVTDQIENKTYFVNARGERELSDAPMTDEAAQEALNRYKSTAEDQLKGEPVEKASSETKAEQVSSDSDRTSSPRSGLWLMFAALAAAIGVAVVARKVLRGFVA
jgi:hypothetical protein